MFAKVISSCIWLLFTETRLISLSLSIALLLKTTFVFMRHKLILTADVLRWLWRDLFSTDDISLHVEVSFLPITLYKFMNSDLRFTKAEFHRHTVCKCRNVLRYVHLLSSQLKTSFLVFGPCPIPPGINLLYTCLGISRFILTPHPPAGKTATTSKHMSSTTSRSSPEAAILVVWYSLSGLLGLFDQKWAWQGSGYWIDKKLDRIADNGLRIG